MTNRKRKARSGYALLIVMIVILTTSALAAVYQRHLSTALRIEAKRIESEQHATGPITVLGLAIKAMNDGDPPAPIEYSYSHDSILYRISYVQSGTGWVVTANPDETATALPSLPASF